MGVQKSKKTRSKIGKRRCNDKINNNVISIDKYSGELHIRHRMTKKFIYKNKNIYNK